MADQLLIVRRRGLGFGSARSILQTLNGFGIECSEWKTWRENSNVCLGNTPSAVVLRWGCTSTLPEVFRGTKVLNTAEAIHRVNDKSQFAQTLSQAGLGPDVFTSNSTNVPLGQYVVRPRSHSRGRDFQVMSAGYIFGIQSDDWYARPLIQKVAEYRVYVMFGKVAAVANKTPPSDQSQVAWNHALGCAFSNVRWSDWPMKVVEVAVDAACLSGLDYAAVDMMVEEGTLTPWVIEINSAGSLPRNEDRSPSYRARCVAKALAWHLKRENYDHFPQLQVGSTFTWKDFIHPGVSDRAIMEVEPIPEPVFSSIRG